MSGIAAILMSLGSTAHKRFGFPIPCHEDSSCNINLQSEQANIIKNSKTMFIDECSMMLCKLLDCLDRFLQELMDSSLPMGGKLVVLMGDFRQILPVVEGGSRAPVVHAAIKTSELWPQFTTLRLSKNMRVDRILQGTEDPARRQDLEDHAKWLLRVGEGTLPTCHGDIIELPDKMVKDTPEDLREAVHDNFASKYMNCDYLSRRAIMTCTNKIVNAENHDVLQ